MENHSEVMRREGKMNMPAGFRFHPRDEELILHYLSKKVLDHRFSPVAIAEVDMNKFEPWELPVMAKMGEKEWYFFWLRERKYSTGQRTNRATPLGYWKATGRDKEIYNGDTLVGMKKSLVFYQGRAPRGEKSNWVCHEYRMDGNSGLQNLQEPAQSDWVIVRVFHKTPVGERAGTSEIRRTDSVENEMGTRAAVPVLPQPEEVVADPVGSFSGSLAGNVQNVLDCSMDCFDNPFLASCLDSFTREAFASIQGGMGSEFPGWVPPPQDPLPFGTLTGNDEHNWNRGFGTGNGVVSQGTEACPVVPNFDLGEQSGLGGQPGPSGSGWPQDHDYIWD